ncbi:hypothetical protein BH11BAC7_BH11BAC7_07510 [soil metagenome]
MFGGTEIFIITIVAILVLGVFVLNIFYLINLQNTLEQVSPENRKMSPGQVWLALIPLFSLVWNFLMIGYIADSLRDEFRKRNIPSDEERPGYQLGLWVCILPLTGWIPILGAFASIGGLVCWIMYWIKMSRYKNILLQTPSYQQFQQHPYQNPQNPYQNPPNPFQEQNPYQNPANPFPQQQNPYQNPNTPPNQGGMVPPTYNGDQNPPQ